MTMIVSLAVTPSPSSVAVSSTIALTATATNPDASTTDVTATSAWTSANGAIATVGAATGIVTGVGGGGPIDVTATFPNPFTGPGVVAVTPSGAHAYVSDFTSNVVAVVDTATNAVVKVIVVGTTPAWLVVTPDGAHVYVVNTADNTVSVIRTSDNTVIATVGVGTNPRELAVLPSGVYVYVTYDDGVLPSVSVIRTSDNTVVATLAVGISVGTIVASPDSAHVYSVSNSSPGTIAVIETTTNTVATTITTPGITSPVSLAVTPDSAHIYVGVTGATDVLVYETTGFTLTHTTTVGSSPISAAMTPDGAHVYVANFDDNTVSVIATSSNAVIATPAVGTNPFTPIISPDGAHVYVVNTADNTVSVIATGSNTVVATPTVGTFPSQMAVLPDSSQVYVTSDVVSVIASPGFTVTTVASVMAAFSAITVTGGGGGGGTLISSAGEQTMYVKLGETIRGTFGTAAFSTGAATDADSLPTCVILDAGSPMGYAPTVVHQATGLYEVPIVASSGNGFVVGHAYSLYVVVVLGGVTARAPVSGVSTFNVVARNTDDLAFPATTGRSLAVDASGVVDGNLQKWIGVVPAALSSTLVQATAAALSGTAPASVATAVLDVATSGHVIAGSVGAAIAATPSVPTIVTAVLDELLSGHAVIGSVGDGIAIATGLLQGNFYLDDTDNTNPNGQTSARVRIFRNSAAASSATSGGSGEGEFASFLLTTTYTGPNKIATHRVVRQ